MFFIFLLGAVPLAISCSKAPDDGSNSRSYHLEIAWYSDTHSRTGECVFVIGDVAYRTVQDLTKGISSLPKDSQLILGGYHGDHGLPFNRKDMDEIKGACETNGIRFVFVPEG